MKAKLFWIFCVVLLPLTVAGRTVQLIFMTEPATGFFKPSYAALGVAMGVLLGLCLAGLLALSRFLKEPFRPIGDKSIPLAAAAFLMAAAQLYEAAAVMLSDTRIGITLVLHMLLLFGSVAFFAMLGVSRISYLPLPHILTVLPVLLWVYKLVAAFIHYTGIANISENILEIALLCFSLLFMLQQGKFLSGDRIKSGRWILGGGICTALLCAAATLPRYILLLCGQGSLIHDGALPNPSDLVLMLYILAFLLSLYPLRETARPDSRPGEALGAQ